MPKEERAEIVRSIYDLLSIFVVILIFEAPLRVERANISPVINWLLTSPGMLYSPT